MSEEKIPKHEIIKNGLNSKQAAAYLGMARKTLDNKRSDGAGPKYWKFGNGVIYYKPDLDAYLDENMSEFITVNFETGITLDSNCLGDLDDLDNE